MNDAADMARWAARDFVFNLEAIPADRLDWKRSPEAKSATSTPASTRPSVSRWTIHSTPP